MTMMAKTALRWRGLRSTVSARYLSRRIGCSQNGAARGSSGRFPLAGVLPLPVGSCGGGAGLRSVGGRCRGPAPVLVLPPDQPRDRTGGGPAGAERPAPRDQLETVPAGPLPPLLPLPLPVPAPDRGGRSSGGAVRLPPLPVSGMFRLRPGLAAVPPRREPGLVWPFPFPFPSPSAAGGASARNRDVYASPAASDPVPVPVPVTAAAWAGFRRAHRATRWPAIPGMATVAAAAVFRRKVKPASRRLTSARSVEPRVP